MNALLNLPDLPGASMQTLIPVKLAVSDLPAPVPVRRYLSVSLPRLSTDRIARLRHGPGWRLAAPPETAPLAIAGRRNNGMLLVALDEKAAAAGLSRGMGLTDARAILPSLDALPEEPAADLALLEAVADWCDRYTPLVARDGTDGLLLDITGCANLFGGEAAMLSDLLAKLFHQGFAATGGIAPTPGAAHAIARYRPLNPKENPFHAGAVPVLDTDQVPAFLAALPLAALRLDGQTIHSLARLGLRSIGQIMARPRAPLARRFGRQLLLQLDRALGHVEEAISPRLPAPVRSAERRLPAAVSRTEDIEWVTGRLAATLCGAMERAGEGARLLDLALFRVDGVVTRLGVGSSRPLREPETVVRLFREKLAALHDDFDAGCGFDLVRLSASACERLDPSENSFLEGGSDEAALLLADRLAARLGTGAVLRALPHDTHVPEAAETLHPVALGTVEGHVSQPQQYGDHVERPLRLLERPEPVEALAEVPDGPPVRFRWRRMLHQVVRAEGPERIAGEWWRGPVATRDYYRIEDALGRRFWLFRKGLFGEGQAPRWFLHGFFA